MFLAVMGALDFDLIFFRTILNNQAVVDFDYFAVSAIPCLGVFGFKRIIRIRDKTVVTNMVAADAIHHDRNGVVFIVIVNSGRNGIGKFVPCSRELLDDGGEAITIHFHTAHERQRATDHVSATGNIHRHLFGGSSGK